MKPKKRQKLCHNCEGEIDLDVIVCPFCAADLREEKPEQGRPSFYAIPSQTIHETKAAQSLYPDPFPQRAEGELPEDPAHHAEHAHGTVAKNSFAATILFTLGVQLFLLGLLMLLFSHKGMIVLRWNASCWFFYCLAGIPLLYFGYRALAKL